jgi:hypothetical protein
MVITYMVILFMAMHVVTNNLNVGTYCVALTNIINVYNIYLMRVRVIISQC